MNLVKQHIERCIELYGVPGDEDAALRKATISRSSYEQMRADLMMAIGMLAALHPQPPDGQIRPIKHPF